MARTAALYAVPALVVATAWLRLEQTGAGAGVLLLVVVAAVPALVRPLWARAAATVAATLVAIRVAFGLSPLDARPFDSEHDFFGPLASRFTRGFLEFYDVPQPFVATDHLRMHAVVLMAIFGFCLVLALALAARRPLFAALVLLVGSMWPATLVPGSDLERGAFTLAVVLALMALGGQRAPRSYRPALVAVAALVVASLAASTSSAVAKEPFVDWRSWDLYDRTPNAVGVDYVWDASYDGLRYPKKRTVVLSVGAPSNIARYWRAATLDAFRGHRWIEDHAFLDASDDRVRLGRDATLPARARDEARWVRADVRVEALRDDHLAAPSVPMAVDPGDVGLIEYRSGNVAVASGGLEHGDEYTIWSYSPQPTGAQLARSRTAALRRHALRRFLEVGPGAYAGAFGSAAQGAAVERLLTTPLGGLAAYRPLYERAREVVGTTRNQYAAVVALEGWFRSGGGFTYDEQPPRGLTAPALVDFVTRTKRGYCQHFAGAMALMLRYLGIPARVAAGFTTGTYDADDGAWQVTDHDAHAWVEVWFDGWGWIPFDPTPGRGRLSGTYSFASRQFDPSAAHAAVGLPGTVAGAGLKLLSEFAEQRLRGSGFQRADTPGDLAAAPTETQLERRAPGGSLLALLAIIAAGGFAVLGLAKLGLRKSRYLTSDPRRVAAACRRELVDFVADQGIDVPRSATLTEVGALVRSRLRVDTQPFVRAASATRFAPPDAARLASRDARRELRRLLRRIRRRTGFARRVRGVVSLRSLAA